MKTTREKTIEVLFYAIVFGVLFVFWTRVSPLMVADAGDWTYISYFDRLFQFGMDGILRRFFRKRLWDFAAISQHMLYIR